jgi:predicted DNA-binding transcriptional regulator YafY
MAVIETMLRHQKIISLLLRRRANFEEIDAMLKYETEIRDPNKRLDISKRTFQRDKEYIQELYGITITCDKDGCYYIEQNDELEADTRFYDMFTLYHELKMEGRLRRGILLEERQETGTRFLKDLLHAIEDNKVVQLRHKEYWEEEGTEYLVQPYFIKEYDQRWYLLAKEVATKKERRFGLDRISHLEVLKEKL